MYYCKNSMQLAQSVKHLVQTSKPNLRWIMIISPGKSEGSYVLDATSFELDGTVSLTLKPSEESPSTLNVTTSGG